MAYHSGFFDAVDLGGGNYDRVYSAETFAHYFGLLVKNGVFPSPSTGLQVVASGVPDMKVTIRPGTGWINGYYVTIPDNDSVELTLEVADPSNPRADSIIMALNHSDREIQFYAKKGTASGSPQPVTLQRDADVYELELAQVTFKAGTPSVTQTIIVDKRQDAQRCGIVSSLIDQIDASGLFAQYDAAFSEWFSTVKDQLSGDVAGNLQNQINALVERITPLEAHVAQKTGNPHKVDRASFYYYPGDIEFTARTWVKSGFLFCDGSLHTQSEYPELFAAIGERFGYGYPRQQISSIDSCVFKGKYYYIVNGEIRRINDNGSTSYVYGNSGIDTEGRSTEKRLCAGDNYIACILTTGRPSSVNLTIAYSTDGLSWKTIRSTSKLTSGKSYFYGAWCPDGETYIFYSKADGVGGRLYITTDFSSLTENTSLYSSSGAEIDNIFYAYNKFIVAAGPYNWYYNDIKGSYTNIGSSEYLPGNAVNGKMCGHDGSYHYSVCNDFQSYKDYITDINTRNTTLLSSPGGKSSLIYYGGKYYLISSNKTFIFNSSFSKEGETPNITSIGNLRVPQSVISAYGKIATATGGISVYIDLATRLFALPNITEKTSDIPVAQIAYSATKGV